MNYSARAFRIKEKEYNYLLPVIRPKLLKRDINWFSVISDDIEDTTDILNRLKGLYNYFDDIPKIIIYNCSKNGSFYPFRDFLGEKTEYPK